jgi:diguanylate cyclase (GGDEF)-like protein
MPSAKFPTRVAALILVAVVGSLIGFTLAISALRDRSNDRAADESIGTMATRLADMHQDLAEVTSDYNLWSSAYEAMLARDLVWIYDNYAASAVNGLVFDGLVLFGEPFAEPLGWSAAAAKVDPSPSHLSSDLLSHLANKVAEQALGERATYDTATVIDGNLVLISATRTQPEAEASRALDPNTFPMAAFTETIDGADLEALAESLFLDEVSFAPQPLPGLTSLPVTTPDGETLGYLSWAPPRPGSEIVTTMAPVLTAAGLIFAVLGCLAAWMVRAHTGQLVWAEAEARRIARLDSMTGVANRLAFAEHMAQLAQSNVPQVAVLFLDLNGFKKVNDTVGHAGGDALVAEVARRLDGLSGDGVFLARLGGDEFVFVLSGASGIAARAGDLTHEVAKAMAVSFSVLGETMHISASQGLALRDAPDVSLDELVRRADHAMYRAKRDRAAAAQAYSPASDERTSPNRERAEASQRLITQPEDSYRTKFN